MVSEHEPRTEAGIGALVPWADRLWAIGYVAHIEGAGLGLHEIAERLDMRRHPASVTGTFANGMIHDPYQTSEVGDGQYVHHEFTAGFSAHWVRIKVDQAATVTAQFLYS